MSRNYLMITVLLVLLCAGTRLSAGEWRRYKYCRKHSCMDGCYKDKHYHPFRIKNYNTAPDENKNKEMEGKYYHTYKNYDRHEGEGYYEYYDGHNKLYYNKTYDDNYRPEVDGNK